MTVLAAWSSDWQAQPVIDEERSVITGRQEFVKNKKTMVYGGTYYMRLAMPTMELAKHGYDSFLSWNLNAKPSGEFVCMDPQGDWHEPDIVWLQRHMGDGMDAAIERAKACGQIVVNDLDDLFWGLPKTNQAYDTTDPIKHPDFNRDHYRKAIAASSAITVSTPALAKEMERLGPPVFLCRNMIDIERWPQLDPTTNGMIGWVGGIAWRANDMYVLKQFLPEFMEDFELPFYHGGDSQVPGVPKAWDQIGLDPTRVKCATMPLCSIQDYPQLWQSINIALIPLEDVKFNHAKSALKALESSACGLPYIASDLPEQRWFTEDGGMGRLAKNWKPATWERHLEELLDPEVRRIEGQANREHAEKFDIANNWQQWDRVFRELGAVPGSVDDMVAA